MFVRPSVEWMDGRSVRNQLIFRPTTVGATNAVYTALFLAFSFMAPVPKRICNQTAVFVNLYWAHIPSLNQQNIVPMTTYVYFSFTHCESALLYHRANTTFNQNQTSPRFTTPYLRFSPLLLYISLFHHRSDSTYNIIPKTSSNQNLQCSLQHSY